MICQMEVRVGYQGEMRGRGDTLGQREAVSLRLRKLEVVILPSEISFVFPDLTGTEPSQLIQLLRSL